MSTTEIILLSFAAFNVVANGFLVAWNLWLFFKTKHHEKRKADFFYRNYTRNQATFRIDEPGKIRGESQ